MDAGTRGLSCKALSRASPTLPPWWHSRVIAGAGVCPPPFPQVRGLLHSEQDRRRGRAWRDQESVPGEVSTGGVCAGGGPREGGLQQQWPQSCGFSRMGMGSGEAPPLAERRKRGAKRSVTLGAVGLGRKSCDLDLVSSTSGGFDESRVSEK